MYLHLTFHINVCQKYVAKIMILSATNYYAHALLLCVIVYFEKRHPLFCPGFDVYKYEFEQPKEMFRVSEYHLEDVLE